MRYLVCLLLCLLCVSCKQTPEVYATAGDEVHLRTTSDPPKIFFSAHILTDYYYAGQFLTEQFGPDRTIMSKWIAVFPYVQTGHMTFNVDMPAAEFLYVLTSAHQLVAEDTRENEEDDLSCTIEIAENTQYILVIGVEDLEEPVRGTINFSYSH